ncbi:MAG TPA: Ig-like domain-containing protein, partial [Gemmatimonadales bacterium]|nr:Ig-like domain-containing protein [Gemmatimonadales bacterium]
MHFRSVAALGALLLSVACEVPVDTNGSNPDFGVTSVAIQPKTASVLVGDSLQLSASVVMSNNRPPNAVNWA